MSDTSTQSAPVLAQLAQFVADARDEGVPEEVDVSVRRRILDTLGVSIAAQRLDTSKAVLDYTVKVGGAAGATVIGRSQKVPASQAAFANGVLAHSLDYDDTHLPSVLHPSASVVPAALAVAESVGASDEAVVAAVAAGLEVAVRLGMGGYDRAGKSSIFFEYGQHATSICGCVGAAAAAGSLLGLDASGIGHAMSISASFASGILEGNRTGGTVKRTHCGWAAHGGVVAAELASAGLTGPPTVFEGKFGFFEAFLKGRFDIDEVLVGLGQNWEVPSIFFKPYPANHFTHAGVDAAIRLREAGLKPEDVESIVLGTASHCARTIGEPIDVKRKPLTGYQGQFSGPYTVAAALFGGHGLGLSLEDFSDELVQDDARRELMARITVVGDPLCDSIFPMQFPATLVVTTKSGETLREEVLTTRGGPARPLSNDELKRKFADNVRGLVRDGAAEELALLPDKKGLLGDVSGLLALTVSPAT
ncbi:MmgE/PrpD family protein [Micromonospora sp. NPDC005087]|uniref:MmgE/PrpD family protein n=1 Tax=Micromonospora sp. NPDC005087 TaxID=3364225 RepID=UPI003692A72E